MIKLTEIRTTAGQYNPETQSVDCSYTLRNIYINPKFIIAMADNEKFNDINNALQGNITYIDNKIDKNINNLNDKINENINYLNNQINNNVKDFLNKPSLFKRIVSWVKKKVFKINE